MTNLADYVLRPMRNAELELAAESIEQAADAVEAILKDGVVHAMNRFNQRIPRADDIST